MPFEHAGRTFGVYLLEQSRSWNSTGKRAARCSPTRCPPISTLLPWRSPCVEDLLVSMCLDSTSWWEWHTSAGVALPKPNFSLRWTMRTPFTFGLCLASGACPLRFTASPCVRVCSSWMAWPSFQGKLRTARWWTAKVSWIAMSAWRSCPWRPRWRLILVVTRWVCHWSAQNNLPARLRDFRMITWWHVMALGRHCHFDPLGSRVAFHDDGDRRHSFVSLWGRAWCYQFYRDAAVSPTSCLEAANRRL